MVKRSAGSVLFGIEYPAPAVDVDASVGCLPLAINKTDYYFGLALVAGKLNRLNQYLDSADS